MVLIVKSRLDRSIRMSLPKVTLGLRWSWGYTSSRNVVISNLRPPFDAPTVPYGAPCMYLWSAHPRSRRVVSFGWALVARSTSRSARPPPRK